MSSNRNTVPEIDNIRRLAPVRDAPVNKDILSNLKGLTDRIYKNQKASLELINDLNCKAKLANAELSNLINEFQMIANQQFVENRVYEEDLTDGISNNSSGTTYKAAEDIYKPQSSKCEETADDSETITITSVIEKSLKFIDQRFIVPTCSDENRSSRTSLFDNEEQLSQVTLPDANRYSTRRLPYLIGCEDYIADNLVGLEATTSENMASERDCEEAYQSREYISDEENDFSDEFAAMPEGQTIVAPPEEQRAISSPERQAPIFLPEQQKTVPLSEQQTTISPPARTASISFPEEQRTKSSPERQAPIFLPEQQTTISPPARTASISLPEEQRTTSSPERQAPIFIPEQQKTVPLSEQQTAISLPEQQVTISPPEQQATISPSIRQSIISPPARQPTISLPEQQATISPPVSSTPNKDHFSTRETKRKDSIEKKDRVSDILKKYSELFEDDDDSESSSDCEPSRKVTQSMVLDKSTKAGPAAELKKPTQSKATTKTSNLEDDSDDSSSGSDLFVVKRR